MERVRDLLEEYPYIASAYLFGPYASNNASPMSDVDIAVLLKDSSPEGRELIHELDYLSYRLQKILQVKEVDLVVLNNQGLIFIHNVLRTGKLIYDADPDLRIRFEAKIISDFCDFEPTLRFMNKYYFAGYKRRIERL